MLTLPVWVKEKHPRLGALWFDVATLASPQLPMSQPTHAAGRKYALLMGNNHRYGGTMELEEITADPSNTLLSSNPILIEGTKDSYDISPV